MAELEIDINMRIREWDVIQVRESYFEGCCNSSFNLLAWYK